MKKLIKEFVKRIFNLEDKREEVECWKCGEITERNESWEFCQHCLTHL